MEPTCSQIDAARCYRGEDGKVHKVLGIHEGEVTYVSRSGPAYPGWDAGPYHTMPLSNFTAIVGEEVADESTE